MKALTLTQPWATLVAIGAKRIETRSWRTPYRGQLVIHAAVGFPSWARDTVRDDPCFSQALNQAGFFTWRDLPRGAIVATARLVGCHPTESIALDFSVPADVAEYAFGDFGEGRWGCFLQGVRRLTEPVPCKGALGLWTVLPEIVRSLEVTR